MEVAIGIIALIVAVAAMIFKWRMAWTSMLEDDSLRLKGRRKKADPPDLSDRPR